MATLFVCMAVVFCKTLFLHCEVYITSCTFHTEQHPPYGVHTVLSGIRKLIFTVPTVKFKYDVSISVVNVHLLVSSTLSVDLESTFTLTQNAYAHATQYLPWYVDLTLHFS